MSLKIEESGNTVLITGGSSGIGLETAKRFAAANNTVLICGRKEEKLAQAKKLIPDLDYFRCDIAQQGDREKLYAWVEERHPDTNILINNAAIVHRVDFTKEPDMIQKADYEIQTNLMAPIALSKIFLPLLERVHDGKIINITTGLVYAPRFAYPIYNATKAALHSFTQVLRAQLEQSPLEVIEVLMPVVNTPWHNGRAPSMAISVEDAVDMMMKGLGRGKEEIPVGSVGLLKLLSRVSPRMALKRINSLS